MVDCFHSLCQTNSLPKHNQQPHNPPNPILPLILPIYPMHMPHLWQGKPSMKHRKLLLWVALFWLTFALTACEISAQTDTPLVLPTAPASQPPTDFNQPLIDPSQTPSEGDISPVDGSDVGSGILAPEGQGEGETSSPVIGEPPTAEPAPTGNTQEQIYTVQAGDSLYRISLIFGVSIEDLITANQLANPNRLELGQELTIPVAGFAATAVPATATATASVEQIHTVRAGDSLFSIGRQYGFTIEELQTYNNLTDPNRLSIGQEIRIPPRQ